MVSLYMKESCEVACEVACTCNPATLVAEFRDGVGLVSAGGNNLSIGGWIV